MKCPHCLTDFHDASYPVQLRADADGPWWADLRTCSACRRLIVELVLAQSVGKRSDGSYVFMGEQKRYLVRPKAAQRTPPSTDVPDGFAPDYLEACMVLGDSPKASAALSRRCLQHLLREVAKVKPADLANEIQEVLDRRTLPSHISESLDAVRNIGNFAAHPMKSKASGEILPVEPGEAEWNLDTLESLFDYYFVQPAIVKRKKDTLNKKLAEAGKPPMK